MDFNAEIQCLQRGVAERDELLCELVEILRDHEPGLKRVLQSIYTLVQDNLLCSTQLVHKVILAVISGSQEEASERRRLLARALVCVQLQLRRIPADDGALVLQELLARASDDVHPYAGQILEHLFSDFVRVLGADCFLRLLDATRTILLSKEPQDRKSSYFLISKIQRMCEIDGEHSEALLNGLQCSAQQWIAFAVIVSVLEEQDPNLIGGTLETQLPQLQLMCSDLGERWLAWLRTICIRLLQEDRVQVLRKTLEYFLSHLSVEHLCRLGLLPEFLMATNRSQLFNYEDDNCLNEEQVKQFVAKGNVELLLEALVVVSWENVPLLVWILSLKSEQVESVPKELFIKLCLKVQTIDNSLLQNGARIHLMLIFKDTIDCFSLRDYMVCMESLFNKGDPLRDSQRLQDKIANCTDFEEHIDCFNQRSFDIFFRYIIFDNWQPSLSHTLCSKMGNLPKHKHGFLRFVFITKHDKLFTNFYRKFYNVDTSLLQTGKSLEEIQVHLLDRLDCQTDEETSFLKARCVDLFTLNLDSWGQLEELNLDPLELMEQGTYDTIFALARLLKSHRKRVTDETVLPALMSRIKFEDDLKNVVDYAYKNLTEEEFESVTINIIIQKKSVCLPDEKLSISLFLKLLLYGEPTTGMARIEEAYAYNTLHFVESSAGVRYNTLLHLEEYTNYQMKSQVFKELLRINGKLSIEHPQYTENSKVHRQKMRIASALIELRRYCDDPKSLETLLLPNDQLGINIMHEFLVGDCVKNIDWALDALPNLEPRQQESYLSIAYIFISKNLEKLNKKNKLSEIFSLLLPFIMGSTRSTRILAQLILHKLAVKCKEKSFCIHLAEVLVQKVEKSLGEKLPDLQSDPRLWLAELTMDYDMSDCILYITNPPFDEIGTRFSSSTHGRQYNRFKKIGQAFAASKLASSGEVAPPQTRSEGLTLPPTDANNSGKAAGLELILVASLLGGEINFPALRRTCEKFGFHSLVVADESHLAEASSGNLSIVKVKSENLVEFILAKQAEGYKAVSSKGSAGTPKFDHFEFPKKCILVLGHENNGIPINVAGVLDYVVEIPQFGFLDTNFGASLLIWEFFKQHCA